MACIVFDLDGTLIDSAPDICGIANKLLESRDLEPITLEQTRDFVGNGPSVFVEKMSAARRIDASQHDHLLRSFLELYDDAVTLTEPYPSVIAALEDLRGAGHRLGICTNKPIKPTMTVLRHLSMDHHFETFVGGDSLTVHKPDPAPLFAAFKDLGSGDRIYVGDSEVDAGTALAAQVPFFLFTEGYRKKPIEELPHKTAFSNFSALASLVDAARNP